MRWDAHEVIHAGSEEVRIREQLLFIPHDFLNGFRDRVQGRVANIVCQGFRHLLVYGVTWIGGRVNAVTKAHDQIFALEHSEHAGGCFFGRVEL